ncbi:DUF4439 domain-containing protein [Brachybacterium sp. YJGR34]|uniref:DUF4439 domain-containing protein n=1 Tax=Brachybacterium sp. YJGR34 TaxID=2059911 RepID=UPI001E2C08AB|nr:DUF4439 domain-containing protein [Brachybacterium sp. YJGR34]
MPHSPHAPSVGRAPVRMTRRGLLRAAALGTLGSGTAASLAGCGPIALGRPEQYTPPPPGIDDLYRVDLLEILDRAIAGTDVLLGAADPAAPSSPELAAALDALAVALPVQRTALLTGAQLEDEREAAEDPAPGATDDPAPTDAPGDAASLVGELMALRDLAADASRQVSGSLARPTSAIAAHSEWTARRLTAAAGAGEVTASPLAADLRPVREVPTADPPSVGARSDYETTLERTQEDEWHAGYLHEVLAARVEGEEREQHLELAARHRERAEELGRIAEEDGAPVVARQAVYAVPGGTLDEETAGALPTQLAQELLIDHSALVGAAPFEHRLLSIAAAMQEAAFLAPRLGTMQPLPGIEVEDPPAASG